MVSEVSIWYSPKRKCCCSLSSCPTQQPVCGLAWTLISCAPVIHRSYLAPTSPSSVASECILFGRRLGIPSFMAHFFFPPGESSQLVWRFWVRTRTASFTVKDTAALECSVEGEGQLPRAAHCASSGTDPVLHWPFRKRQGSSLCHMPSPRLDLPFISRLSRRREPSLWCVPTGLGPNQKSWRWDDCS